MECEASDSKKLLKVLEASKRRKCRKKREVLDDSLNSEVTMDTNSKGNVHIVKSAKAILTTAQGDAAPDTHSPKRDRDSSPSGSPSPVIDLLRPPRSPRRHRRSQKEGISLALKAGLVSTPRSGSPRDEEMFNESVPQDQDSFIYALFEEAFKKDKRKQRHARRHEERRASRDREPSVSHEHRHHHHHRRRHEDYYAPAPRCRHCTSFKRKHRGSSVRANQKEVSNKGIIDQSLLLETFAKLCVQMNEKVTSATNALKNEVMRTQSHKSLQCEVEPKRDHYDIDQRPTKLRSQDVSRDNIPTSMTRSHDNIHDRSQSKMHSPNRSPSATEANDKYFYCSRPRGSAKTMSKFDFGVSRTHMADEVYRHYPQIPARARHEHDQGYRNQEVDPREYREYDEPRVPPMRDRRNYCMNDRCEQKTSRSFDVQREYLNEERNRRTTRSDSQRRRFEDCRELRDPRDKRYEEPRDLRDFREKRFDDRREKYYDEKYLKHQQRNTLPKGDWRSRRNLDRFERNSVVSRDDDRERDRFSERERDSGLSVADGDTSTVSGRSNYLKVVKQEIAEQREAMDKMMKLWKELMRCFKGISQNQGQEKAVQDSAVSMQESAAAQLRLWRECMRRYETVARDVGDTDARLMEEINKQRSEMSEMANMWQECLQRYRDMSSDFNNLKQKLATSESPSRVPAAPMVCSEGEGVLPVPPYRLPPHYPPPSIPPPPGGYNAMGAGPGGALRARASMPPAWWWCGEQQPAPPQRRRSSPESRGSRRGSRSRERRHRHKDRDESRARYKEKAPKPNAARSEHRHRKR